MLHVKDLSIAFETKRGVARVLDRVSLEIAPGEIVGLVGESGSGKSVLSYAISGLLDPAAVVGGGVIEWRGRPTEFLRERRVPKLPIAQVFQSPRTSLNPTRTIGRQLADVAGAARVASLLRSVRLPEARASAYPSELSGGQCQRVGIALALGCEPELLVADEPTTGLDVLTEAAILDLIADLARQRGMATLLVTHDLALAVARCSRIVVMHAGQMVESAEAHSIASGARHPYTAALRSCVPQFCATAAMLSAIPGQLPDLTTALPACRFGPRCERHRDDCDAHPVPVVQIDHDHLVCCRHPLC
jgi:peptide/nickel transport system ATP-binding protein